MRKGFLTCVLAAAALITFLATPALADIGVYCGGWDSSTGVSGLVQNACYDRNADYTIRARGKAYYTGSANVDQISVSVQLQKAVNDGSPGNWSNVKSNVCGWTGGGIESGPPGNICNTPFANVDAGYLYRGRVSVTVFFHNGSTDTTSFSYSPLTT
ncbi:MAG: hypothetical protein ACXWFU_05140 [Actinomycetota bacterium]